MPPIQPSAKKKAPEFYLRGFRSSRPNGRDGLPWCLCLVGSLIGNRSRRCFLGGRRRNFLNRRSCRFHDVATAIDGDTDLVTHANLTFSHRLNGNADGGFLFDLLSDHLIHGHVASSSPLLRYTFGVAHLTCPLLRLHAGAIDRTRPSFGRAGRLTHLASSLFDAGFPYRALPSSSLGHHFRDRAHSRTRFETALRDFALTSTLFLAATLNIAHPSSSLSHHFAVRNGTCSRFDSSLANRNFTSPLLGGVRANGTFASTLFLTAL